MKITVRLTEKELDDAVALWVRTQSTVGSLSITPVGPVLYSTIERDYNQGKETTASISCEVGEK
jgi:hypothetical protein